MISDSLARAQDGALILKKCWFECCCGGRRGSGQRQRELRKKVPVDTESYRAAVS